MGLLSHVWNEVKNDQDLSVKYKGSLVYGMWQRGGDNIKLAYIIVNSVVISTRVGKS